MLSLERFRALAQSYGADLPRWPEEWRAGAAALLADSAEARQVLREARRLDALLLEAGQAEAAMGWSPAEEDAALARLRAVVAARIAAPPARRRHGAWAWSPVLAWPVPAGGAGAMPASLRWAGMAFGGGAVLLLGFWVGWLQTAPPGPGGLAGLLQAAPFQALAW
ncbi:conserved protein of unknown function [Rhodovastum atsumiense]|uniref:hypothetical protein n=1 Tax=Rhodovastum atsumiense TaxID=504468 RepID=UPI00139F2B4E|nr:hypothetical protein [Rhodovastum atsumiense]CAH2601974.1 conserved protein of unknown function [Rhodovastum atsumiense]